ncbi:MAG: hypothetical protein RSC00_10440, partial [Ruthenibacterium sp.]
QRSDKPQKAVAAVIEVPKSKAVEEAIEVIVPATPVLEVVAPIEPVLEVVAPVTPVLEAVAPAAPPAASREQQVSARRTAHFPARRTALIAAAAVVLIAVPSLYLVLGGAGLHTSDKAAAPAEALSEAATGAAFSSNIALDGAAPEAAPREPAASLQGEDHPAGAAPGAALGAVPGDSKQESGSFD